MRELANILSASASVCGPLGPENLLFLAAYATIMHCAAVILAFVLLISCGASDTLVPWAKSAVFPRPSAYFGTTTPAEEPIRVSKVSGQ